MMSDTHTEPAPTLDDVWRLIRETDRQLREQSQEADRRFKEQAQEAKRRAQEADRRAEAADRRFQETERFLKQQSQETDRRFQETERFLRQQSEETGRYLKAISRETDEKLARLGNRLGEFVEGLVAPALIRVFQARGIAVNGLSRDISRKNPSLNLATQIDLFVISGDSCILIEVKSKLSIEDVNEHIERMKKFKPLFPEYTDKKVYGAVAAMVIPNDVAKYAYRKGFFVLAQQGDTVAILNDDNFQPLVW